jgi:hypothetical protein
MDESTNKKPEGWLDFFLKDEVANRIIGRGGQKIGEDADFIYIVNEGGKKEALPKRLIVRYLERKAGQGAGSV